MEDDYPYMFCEINDLPCSGGSIEQTESSYVMSDPEDDELNYIYSPFMWMLLFAGLALLLLDYLAHIIWKQMLFGELFFEDPMDFWRP